MKFHILLILLCACCLLHIGCSKEKLPEGMPTLGPIKLKLTTDGSTPLESASVTLVPENAEMTKWLAGGTTDGQGVCLIRTLGRYDGAPVGKYKVIVQKTIIEGGASGEVTDAGGSSAGGQAKSFHLVGKEYRSPQTTPLEVEVQEKANPDVTLDTGKPVRESIALSAG